MGTIRVLWRWEQQSCSTDDKVFVAYALYKNYPLTSTNVIEKVRDPSPQGNSDILLWCQVIKMEALYEKIVSSANKECILN